MDVSLSLERTHKIHSWLLGKKVLIIGGADFVEFRQERYDVVCRLNNHWLRQGGRCDVLMHNCCLSAQPYETFRGVKDSGLKCFIGNTARHTAHSDLEIESIAAGVMFDSFSFEREYHLNRKGLQHTWSQFFMAMYDFKPFTGLNMIEYLRQSPCAEIAVTGMTLHKENEKSLWVGPHHIPSQALYLEHISAYDNRVFLGERLKSALQHYVELI